jgi:thiosulfate/3-mercaptopyruvate sulfurtransferase
MTHRRIQPSHLITIGGMTSTHYPLLISAPQLKALQTSGQPHMLFDCSFDLMNPAAGEAAYGESHIPGAVYVHLDRDLSDKTGNGVNGGRHPLPQREKFAAWLGSVGFTNAMQAVVYDRQGVNYAGRLWWMLKWVGHDNVAVLDGGLQAWQATEAVTAQVTAPRPPATFKLGSEKAQLVLTATVEQQLGRPAQTIVDARAAPRFRGEVEPLDPVAGHIPGALNRPFANNIGADGKFKPTAVLRAEFDVLLAGRDPASVVHHCGSGVSAVPNVIAMELAGLGRAALYAGSWSEWSANASRPFAQG